MYRLYFDNMAPKQEISKKNQKKKVESRIEDSTFGLKNKNKSAKVQQYVDRVTKGARNGNELVSIYLAVL